MTKNNNYVVFGLSASMGLAEKVAKQLGVELSPINILRFSDGEMVITPEISVRGKHVMIIQSTCEPVSDNLMELLITVDAMKRSSAKSISVIIPYIAYARQDRKTKAREPITFKLIANMLEGAGVDRILTFDIHSDQTQGFFDIPFDSLRLSVFLLNEFIKKHDLKNMVIVSPDYGGIKRARDISDITNKPLAIIDKRRPAPNSVEIKNILGDVKDKNCLIFDDMIDTGGTMIAASKLLKEHGAKTVSILVTHGIFSGDAVKNFNKANDEKIIDYLLVTDTIEKPKEIKCLDVVSVAEIVADIIRLFNKGVGSMHEIINKHVRQISCKVNAKPIKNHKK